MKPTQDIRQMVDWYKRTEPYEFMFVGTSVNLVEAAEEQDRFESWDGRVRLDRSPHNAAAYARMSCCHRPVEPVVLAVKTSALEAKVRRNMLGHWFVPYLNKGAYTPIYTPIDENDVERLALDDAIKELSDRSLV